jgi:hypothetical protein
MKNAKLLWLIVILLAVGVAFYGCSKLRKEKPAEAPISVETPTEEPAEEPAEEAAEEPSEEPAEMEAGKYVPAKLDLLKMLDDTLGASEDNLGWDNIYTSVSLDKDVELFTTLQGHYNAGTADRTFIDDSITELGNIKTYLDEKVSKAEGVDPTGTDAKAKKKTIATIRARVRAMIGGPAPKKPIPEAKGDAMKKKWNERGEMMKKKWAERGK